MGVDVKAYAGILTKNKEDKASIETNIHYNVRQMRAAFDLAAHGIDIVTTKTLSEIAGKKILLQRSHPDDPTNYDFRDQVKAIRDTIIKKVTEGNLSPEDSEKLERDIKSLATSTGMHIDFLKNLVQESEAGFRIDEQKLNEKFWPFPVKETNKSLRLEIAEMAKRATRPGPWSQEDEDRGNVLIDRFAQGENIAKDALLESIDTFQKKVTEHDAEHLKKDADSFAENMKVYGSTYLSDKAPYIIVADYPPDYPIFKDWIMADGDFPSRKPPGTIQQWEFVSALHEAEHATLKVKMYSEGYLTGGENNYPEDISQGKMMHIIEIDADRASMGVLDSLHEPAMKEYFLQRRQIGSFQMGASHDTATFLRVLEKTGKYIDVEKFDVEKKGLMVKIDERLIDRTGTKIGNIMGAVQDILRDNEAEKDPAKKLSRVQKAEAKSFLEDAEALGYTALPNYPRPAQASATAPVNGFIPSAKMPAA